VGAQGVLGALTNVMGSMGQTSEKAFKAYKALAIAQAIISTYQAAAMAIAFPPGPPLSLIYVAGAVAAGMAQVAAIRAQKYSGRAVGGPVASNSPYIVGERGPELFVPGTAGNIVPNNQLGGGGEPVTVNFTILANDTRDFDQLLTSRQGLITQIIRDAQQERGTRIGF
jgi:SLT domain-containing protein